MPVVDQALEELRRLLNEANVDPDEVGPALRDLAEAVRITPPGDLRPQLGQRPRLALQPNPLEFPLVPTPDGDVRIDADIRWSFEEDGRGLTTADVHAVNLRDAVVEPLVKPKVAELRRADGRPDRENVRRIVPKVRLRLTVAAGGQTVHSGPVTLPPPGVPSPPLLLIAPVQVPRLLALFRHKGFAATRPIQGAGWVLVVVSRPTGLDLDLLDDRLGEVADVASTLTRAFPALTGTVGQIAALAGHLDAFRRDRKRVLVDSSVPALAEVGIPYDGAKVEAGNAASSLIFLGVGGAKVECWSGANDFHRRNHARFTLDAGAGGAAAIADLHSDAPQPTPSTAEVTVDKKPGAANTFGDAISAIRFVAPEAAPADAG